MTRGAVYILFVSVFSLITVALLTAGSGEVSDLTAKRQLVKALGITDIALCSEARYTRHPSQADLFSPFQDFPAAFEHFPTGSIIPPNPIGFSSRILIQRQSEKQN